MNVEQHTREALDLKNLQFPPSPRIEALEYQPYEDSTGEDSLEVFVIISDSTRDEEITGENVIEIKSAIRESLLSKGVNLFPYIEFITRSDYDALEKSQ